MQPFPMTGQNGVEAITTEAEKDGEPVSLASLTQDPAADSGPGALHGRDRVFLREIGRSDVFRELLSGMLTQSMT